MLSILVDSSDDPVLDLLTSTLGSIGEDFVDKFELVNLGGGEDFRRSDEHGAIGSDCTHARQVLDHLLVGIRTKRRAMAERCGPAVSGVRASRS